MPLITVLFMASVMFALFMPEGREHRPAAARADRHHLFVTPTWPRPCMAGCRPCPGAGRGGEAVGLSYWRSMGLVVLPQNKIAIPPIVNGFISLFKDTSLVVIIAIFDFAYAGQKC
ncbi:MAG: hypothetical protein R3E48_11145 [Burkholderiaceae bacterium]